jgi:hypothetical protein
MRVYPLKLPVTHHPSLITHTTIRSGDLAISVTPTKSREVS